MFLHYNNVPALLNRISFYSWWNIWPPIKLNHPEQKLCLLKKKKKSFLEKILNIFNDKIYVWNSTTIMAVSAEPKWCNFQTLIKIKRQKKNCIDPPKTEGCNMSSFNVDVWIKKRNWLEDHTGYTRVVLLGFALPRHIPGRQKACRCKTKCISSRQKDIKNETGKRIKRRETSCGAFQISADMDYINIQPGWVMVLLLACFLRFQCKNYYSTFVALHFFWVVGELLCAHEQMHKITQTQQTHLVPGLFRCPGFVCICVLLRSACCFVSFVCSPWSASL